MGRKKKEIVCVKNDALNMNYSQFSLTECRLWFVLLARVRNVGKSEISITYSEFAELANLAKGNPSYMEPIAKATMRRIQSMTVLDCQKEEYSEDIWFFMNVRYKKDGITFFVNPEYINWVNNLLANYTRFELEKFTALKTRAAQEIYLKFKKDVFKNDGVVWISLADLKERLAIGKYRTKDITTKVLKPAIDELNCLSSLDEKIAYRAVKDGREIVGYELAYESNQIFREEVESKRALSDEDWDEDEPW